MTARGFVNGLWLFILRRAVQPEIRIHEKYYGWRRGRRCVDAKVGSVLKIDVERYRGERVVLPDDTEVCPGDRIIELHFNNERLRELHSGPHGSAAVGIRLRREFKESLAELARLIAGNPLFEKAVALRGETILKEIVMQLGFEMRSVPASVDARLKVFYARMLIAEYHPEGLGRLAGLEGREMVVIWMSVAELIRRYGAAVGNQGAP